MLHRALRVPRIGYALVLLPVFLGSASGAPAPDVAARGDIPIPLKSAPSQVPADRPAFVSATIPCISGTCEVQIYAPAAPAQPLPRPHAAPEFPTRR